MLNVDGLSRWIGAPISTYGVDGFFFLSGFLVYPSLIRLGNVWRFLGARLTRLWPGLALCIALVTLAGAFFTEAHGLAYLRGDTFRFIVENLTFLKGYYYLTGIECAGSPCNINGSLWTLPSELRCYLLLAALAAVGLAAPARMVKFVYPATLIGALAWDTTVREFAQHWLPSGVMFLLDIMHRLWPLFCLGTAAYVFRNRVRLSWLALAGLLVLDLISVSTPMFLQVRAVFVGYGVLCLGILTARYFQISHRAPDYSYGMYIYGRPVMMGLFYAVPGLELTALWAATTLLTAPLAALSWHFVEKPALDVYKNLFRDHKPLPRGSATIAPS